jgi:membrane fusion protein, multidrug efflux system
LRIQGLPRICPTLAVIAGVLISCKPSEEPAAQQPRPVRVVTVERQQAGEAISLTGQVEAETEVNLSFRIGGRMIARSVSVGDRVKAGQVIARLEPEPAENALRAARANLASAMSLLTKTRNDFNRQDELLRGGWTTRVRHDQALHALQAAQAQADAARAQEATAEDNLSYTELVADAPGHVTAVGAEPGEVVQPGRMIVQLAREGGRDAVFDVPARIIQSTPYSPIVAVTLASGSGSARHRTRARSRAAGGPGNPHFPGSSRSRRSARDNAPRLDGDRINQARGHSRGFHTRFGSDARSGPTCSVDLSTPPRAL